VPETLLTILGERFRNRMSISQNGANGIWKIRWRKEVITEANRCAAHELAKKIERKNVARDENRPGHQREVNFRMSALIDRYWNEYGSQEEVERVPTGEQCP